MQQPNNAMVPKERYADGVRKPVIPITSKVTIKGAPSGDNVDQYLVANGIKPLGLKPESPGPEDCCMSGCAVCVYDLYKEDLEDWAGKRVNARRALEEKGLAVPAALKAKSTRGASDENQEDWAKKEVEDELVKSMDTGMRALWELERKLKRGKSEPGR